MEKKSYERPQAGVFYLVPDPARRGKYTILSEVEEGGNDPVHLFLFDKAKRLLSMRFKVDLDGCDCYTGIPRGRIMEPKDRQGDWIVAHGGDFPLDEYRGDIFSDFSLHDAAQIGKVRFVVENHEKMDRSDREEIEASLGIKFTPTGWKKV